MRTAKFHLEALANASVVTKPVEGEYWGIINP
jgi:hypothetical protein